LEDEDLAREALEEFIGQIPYLELLGSYESPLDLLILNVHIDLVFSDIRMLEMDGISYLKSLINPPIFIFVTGNPEYAAESYDLDVLDFVQKPFNFTRIMKAANKAKAVLDLKNGAKKDSNHLIIKDRYLYTILEYDHICYVKGNKDYVTIETIEKTFTLWRTLGDILRELPKDRFLQVHKSYIVHVNFVKSIAAKKLIMKGGLSEVPIGDTFKDEVRRHFGIG